MSNFIDLIKGAVFGAAWLVTGYAGNIIGSEWVGVPVSELGHMHVMMLFGPANLIATTLLYTIS
jgi:hypothetical protein